MMPISRAAFAWSTILTGTVLLGFASGVLFQRFIGAGTLVRAVLGGEAGDGREAAGAPTGVPDELRGRLSLFVLAGQSNMSGRGEVPASQEVDPGVFVFGNDYRWKPGREPVDDPHGQVDQVSDDSHRDPAGFGPGRSFGQSVRRHRPDVAIGRIPGAKGDTAIAQWQRSLSDATLYGSCLKRVRAASLEGIVSGLLFFQGEADALDPVRYATRNLAPTDWNTRFSSVIDHFRTDIGIANLPVVFAQIGTNAAPEAFVNWAVVQEQQAAVNRPCTAMITTDDLPLMDAVHFTTDSYRVIGLRLSDAYLRVAEQVECR
jgi:hypothetical protein